MNRVRVVRDVLLRPTAESELDRLSELTETVYGVRREPEVLRWLLFQPGAGREVESLVAERRGRVVGHVASLECRYRVHGRTVSGAHRMLWMVEADARGAAGVPLAGRSPDTDFEVVLGGTAATKAMLVMRGFREVGEALEVRLPTGAAREAAGTGVVAAEEAARDAGRGASPEAAFGGSRRGRRRTRRVTPAEEAGGGRATGRRRGRPDAMGLGEWDPAARAAPNGDDVLVNVADPDHLAWLASCPEHDALLLTLESAGEPLGPVLLYVNRANDPPTGRIVHMPHLADGAGLARALGVILDRLRREGCADASVLATEEDLLQAAGSLGGEVFYRRPLWFRNPNGEGGAGQVLPDLHGRRSGVPASLRATA